MNGEKGLMVAGGVVAVAKRRSSVVEGALILGVSGVVTRLIGAFFKIPLGNLLGGSGMGAFTVAYQIYSALFLLSTAGLAVEPLVDYSAGGTGLPAADVLQYRLAGGAKFMVRPSGTEPKIKVYLSAVGKSEAEADAVNERMAQAAAEMMHA